MLGAQFGLNDPVFFRKIKKKPPAKKVVHIETSI